MEPAVVTLKTGALNMNGRERKGTIYEESLIDVLSSVSFPLPQTDIHI
jgi:hypothetical protein